MELPRNLAVTHLQEEARLVLGRLRCLGLSMVSCARDDRELASHSRAIPEAAKFISLSPLLHNSSAKRKGRPPAFTGVMAPADTVSLPACQATNMRGTGLGSTTD